MRESGCLVPQFPRLRLHLRRSPRPSLKSRCPAEMCSSPLFHCWYSRFGLTDSASHRFRRPKWPLRLSDHRHSLSDRQMSVNHRQLRPKWPLRSSDRRHPLSDLPKSVNHRQLHPKWPLRSSHRRHRQSGLPKSVNLQWLYPLTELKTLLQLPALAVLPVAALMRVLHLARQSAWPTCRSARLTMRFGVTISHFRAPSTPSFPRSVLGGASLSPTQDR